MQSAMDWVEGQRVESGWSMRSLLVLSLVGHLCLMLGLMLTPGPAPLRMPQSLTVELVAAVPVAPKPPAPPPAPTPTPTPTPAPAPPPPKPKVKILPKQAPSVQLKPKPKPKPEPALHRRPRPKELAYEDALAQLRGELGEPPAAMDSPEPAESPAPAPDSPSARSSQGVKVDPELLAWHQAVKRHIRAGWVNPHEFRNRGLAAELVIDVAIDGRLLGRPKLVASSGNPFYDDNAVRALTRVSPLPPPPKAGPRTIVFTSEE